jgi:hypothetical protein
VTVSHRSNLDETRNSDNLGERARGRFRIGRRTNE